MTWSRRYAPFNVEASAGQSRTPAIQGQRCMRDRHPALLQTRRNPAFPLRTSSDGSIVRIKDIGRTELGTERYDVLANYMGKQAAALAIRQAAGANALETADNVRNKLKEMAAFFPPGMKVIYPYDTTPFTKVAIDEVVRTLFEAIVLVFLIMWLFMGNMRATLIPTIAVPVVLLGTFAVLALFGFSINMLTMFAMVLAIGLLVDDAIVVVENVERIMAEEGLPPREATARSMEQITRHSSESAWFSRPFLLPMAFFGGSTGSSIDSFP
jgi:HAE1 family hydrophobic/amphiphilic exporter-1